MSNPDPFQDIAIREALGPDGSVSTRPFEEANPFANESTPPATHGWDTSNPTPAEIGVNSPSFQPQQPPAYSRTGQQQLDPAAQDALERRERELNEKAAELERRERSLQEQGPPGLRKNNWPPLPEKFCVGPCFYQDINVEIPPEFQRVVRLLYYLWMYHSTLMLGNFIGALALLIKFGQGENFGLSILYMLLFTPLGYVCWFRPIYQAFRNDSSFNFMIFFFIFFFQLMVTSVHAIGIPGLGTCGIIIGLETVTANAGAGGVIVGILVLLVSIGFIAGALMDFLMLLKVHKIYRSAGASFAKAQEEVRSGVLRNDTARNFMADAASAAVRSGINSTTGTGPRF